MKSVRQPTSKRSRSESSSSATPLRAVIITNDPDMAEEAAELCRKLQQRKPGELLEATPIVDLEEIMAHNNGSVAVAATQASKADVVLCFLDPHGYFPMYWKQWFRNWAGYRSQATGLILGRVEKTGLGSRRRTPADQGEDLESFYQELAHMGAMEFIPVDAAEGKKMDWNSFQRMLVPTTAPQESESVMLS